MYTGLWALISGIPYTMFTLGIWSNPHTNSSGHWLYQGFLTVLYGLGIVVAAACEGELADQ